MSRSSFLIEGYSRDYLIEKFSVDPNKILVAPFWYEQESNRPVPFEDREHFVMLGNFLHPPNVDALRWCRNSLWKSIRSVLPSAQLHVYGAYPTKQAKDMHQPSEGLFVHGPVASLPDLFRKYRVNFAPLRFGAGIKGKVTDGWYYGLPCLTTHIGAEGLCSRDDLRFGGIVANNDSEMQEGAQLLYNNPDLWKSHQLTGRELIQHYFSSSSAERFQYDLEEKIEQKEALRNNNYIGSMLRYSSMRYTEFMSRYIGRFPFPPLHHRRNSLTQWHLELKNNIPK